ncbi:hypothetical protein Hte_008755 [Hypoxylon texense]
MSSQSLAPIYLTHPREGWEMHESSGSRSAVSILSNWQLEILQTCIMDFTSTLVNALWGKPTYTVITDLANKVLSASEKNYNGADFLPHDQLDKIVTREEVDNVLKDAGVRDSKSLAQFVLEKPAKKLFLILVMMSDEEKEKISLLADLRQSSISDVSLPIKFEYDIESRRHRWFSLEGASTEKSDLCGKWARPDCDLFAETYQWRFIAPVFGGETFRFHFQPQRVLPYLQTEPKPSSSGFFGEVSRIMAHKAHFLSSESLPASTDKEDIAIAIKKAKHDEQLAEFFDREASNLHKLQQYESPHLIKPIAAYQIHEDRCLIFPWADGGNLLNYCEKYEHQREDVNCLIWLLRQLQGVCSAVQEMHKNNARHGDLKPENILWFKDSQDRGILQIADLGLAAFHEKEAHTQNRKGMKTFTPSGTSRYEPPEMDENRDADGPRSRQYDIWSMGCVMLELLLWLVYGHKAVGVFKNHTTHFWECHDNPDGKKYIVHPYVDSCMKVLMKSLPDNSAHKDLLSIVQDRLLVLAVSEPYESSPECRETAEALHLNIAHVVEKSTKKESTNEETTNESADSTSYLTPIISDFPADEIREQLQRNVVYQVDGALAAPRRKDVPRSSTTLTTDHTPSTDGDHVPKVMVRAPTAEFNSSSLSTNASMSTKHQQHASTLNDEWDSTPDNEFAAHVLKLVGWDKVKPEQPTTVLSLCSNCSSIDSALMFNGEYSVADIELMSHGCDLCGLLFRALDGANIRPPRVVTINQDGATVRVKDGPKLLSIYADPDSGLPEGSQAGLPTLLQPASHDQFTLLKRWIDVCDSSHEVCRRKDEDALVMPTRLIEVGNSIKLIDSASISPSPYIALSHCWGPIKGNAKFCTFKRNIDQLKRSIDLDRLPLLFRDAISIVRGLGLRYIWIDSLCIIQDDELDWETEAGRMEQVFSGAYFTIAASSAKSSNESFLSPRQPRPCVQLSTQNAGRLYVCLNIDNFQKDVELGELNRRGSKAAFLGDANFPESALEYYRDGRQVLVQDLYERYSGLAFTKPSDRSVAILGLQKRLARAFETQAAFGLLAVYFGRGLLWQRRDARIMKRIAWPGGRHVPTWSWFSKEGPIKYMKLEFEKIDWATKEFKRPFPRHAAARPKNPTDGQGDIDLTALRGVARKLHLTKLEMLVRIIFDAGEEFEIENLRCVVIGRDKVGSGTDEPKQHVLVIHPLNVPGKETYERVGVASLRPAHVGEDGSWVTIY